MKFILDYEIWRCGLDGKNSLGKGLTALKNPEGYQCCLGQFVQQVKPDLSQAALTGGTPAGLCEYLPPFTDKRDDEDYFTNTMLSGEAIYINDNEETTPQEKIEKLKVLFKAHGHEIEVINQPQIVENEVHIGL